MWISVRPPVRRLFLRQRRRRLALPGLLVGWDGMGWDGGMGMGMGMG